MEKSAILKSKTYYTGIIGLTFSPMRLYVSLDVSVKKGERYWWKLLGLIPIIPLRAKEDLYKDSIYICKDTVFDSRYATLKKINNNLWRTRIATKEGVFDRPYIEIFREGEVTEHKYFNSDQEARTFLEDMKSKCKEYGNILS